MAVKDLITAELEALAGVRHANCGAVLPARNEDWADEAENYLIHLANSAAGWCQVKPDDAAATTVRVLAGRAMVNGVVLVYAGGTISLSSYNNDTAYVWLQNDGSNNAQISAAADGTGWPAVPHIKLAEVTLSGGVITGILDRRSELVLSDGSGTIATSLTIGRELATAKLKLSTNGATGNYTLTLVPANLTANRTVTIPDEDIVLASKAYVDAAILGLDYQDSVLDRDLATPPGSPTNGARYIVAASPTGAWTGHAKDIAEWSASGGAWVFTTPNEGFSLRVEDENVQLVYDGSAWTIIGTATDLDGVADGSTYKRVAGVVSNLITFASIATEIADEMLVAEPSINDQGDTSTPTEVIILVSSAAGGFPLSSEVIVRVRICNEDGYGNATNATIAAGTDTDLLETITANKDLILRAAAGTVRVNVTDATPETVTLRIGAPPVGALRCDYTTTLDITHAAP